MVVKVAEKNTVQCTMVGDAMIGKSTLVHSFMEHQRPGGYVATVFETFEGSLDVEGQKQVIHIADYAGQHDLEGMRSSTYKDSDVLVVCFSVADRESFESVKDFWLPEIKNCVSKKRPVILVATQTDLRDKVPKGESVSVEEGEQLAKDINADTFLECSAFEQDKVKHVFEHVVTSGLRYRKRKNNLVHRFFGK